MHIGFHVTCLLFLSGFNKTVSTIHIFGQHSDTKFSENMSHANRVVPRGQSDRHTDMTNLIVTFRNSAKASKNQCPISAAVRIVGRF